MQKKSLCVWFKEFRIFMSVNYWRSLFRHVWNIRSHQFYLWRSLLVDKWCIFKQKQKHNLCTGKITSINPQKTVKPLFYSSKYAIERLKLWLVGLVHLNWYNKIEVDLFDKYYCFEVCCDCYLFDIWCVCVCVCVFNYGSTEFVSVWILRVVG